jgi:hypothetical protein
MDTTQKATPMPGRTSSGGINLETIRQPIYKPEPLIVLQLAQSVVMAVDRCDERGIAKARSETRKQRSKPEW